MRPIILFLSVIIAQVLVSFLNKLFVQATCHYLLALWNLRDKEYRIFLLNT
jgi:hypothetical protein